MFKLIACNNKVNNIQYVRDISVPGIAGNCFSGGGVSINSDGFQIYQVINHYATNYAKNIVTLVDPSDHGHTNVSDQPANDLRYRWCDIWGMVGWKFSPEEDMPGNDDERLRFLRYSEGGTPHMSMDNNAAHIMGRFFTGPGEDTWDDPDNEKHVLSIESAGIGSLVGLHFWVDSDDDNKLKLHFYHNSGLDISFYLTIRFGPRWDE